MNKTNDGTGKRARTKNVFASSMIIGALTRAAAWIYRKLEVSLIGGLFTAYNREDSAAKDSALCKALKHFEIGERIFTPAKRRFARGIENSAVLGFIRRLLDSLLSSSMKSYGIFVFSASLYSAIVYGFRVFYFGAEEIGAESILTLIVMLISSVLMIASRHTLASALITSPFARFVVFRVAGIRRETLEGREAREDRFNIPFIAGLIFGILSFFIRPLVLFLIIFGAVAAYMVLIQPEFGVLAIFIALPFAPTMGLVAAVLYTTVCFLLKAMCGKRSLKFDLLDAVVMLFLLLMACGGIFSASSLSIQPALVYCVFMLGYFLTVNLIRSREWFMRCVVGTVSSCTAVSLYGLFQNFFGFAESTWHDTLLFTDIEGRVVSTFENPNVLAEYLIMVLPLILAAVLIIKHPRERLALICALAACGGCLIYTWSRGAWLGFIIGIIIFMLMYNRKTLTVLLFGSLAVPFLPFVLPENIIQRFTSIGDMRDGSTVYRVNIWRGVTEMLGDYWQSGVGIGEAAFSRIYRLYALGGIETAPHSHNLYLQILAEIGIVGLIAFAAVIFLWMQSSFTLHANDRRGEKLYSSAIFCGITAVLAQGMTDYIWYNYRVFLMFWLMIGLGAAIRKTLNATTPEELI